MRLKTLLIDIETSPLISYTWGLYDQNVIKRIQTFTILSVAYKWLGGRVEVISCRNQSENALLLRLHALLDEADVVIAHNGDSFDIKKINARFIIHKMAPPSPYRTIDTKKEAKRIAAFDSNSLNNLGLDLGEGQKVEHRGFAMWEGCMAGKSKDWADMEKYNKQDVELLERIYLRLRPWMKHHPTMSDSNGCPKCGSVEGQKRGSTYSNGFVYQRIQCHCGGWYRQRIGDRLATVCNA